MVAYYVEWKRDGLKAADIMNVATPTDGLKFYKIKNKIGQLISGAHTRTSAGRYAHMELEELITNRKSHSDYVEKVRKWADDHIKGGADALPGYFKRGAEIPDHIKQEEMKQKNCTTQ